MRPTPCCQQALPQEEQKRRAEDRTKPSDVAVDRGQHKACATLSRCHWLCTIGPRRARLQTSWRRPSCQVLLALCQVTPGDFRLIVCSSPVSAYLFYFVCTAVKLTACDCARADSLECTRMNQNQCKLTHWRGWEAATLDVAVNSLQSGDTHPRSTHFNASTTRSSWGWGSMCAPSLVMQLSACTIATFIRKDAAAPTELWPSIDCCLKTAALVPHQEANIQWVVFNLLQRSGARARQRAP